MSQANALHSDYLCKSAPGNSGVVTGRRGIIGMMFAAPLAAMVVPKANAAPILDNWNATDWYAEWRKLGGYVLPSGLGLMAADHATGAKTRQRVSALIAQLDVHPARYAAMRAYAKSRDWA
jgi:hypothetical protein